MLAAVYSHSFLNTFTSSVGAAGPILGEAVKRISSALNADGNTSADMLDATIRRSFVLSSDQAHALHPNYAKKHEKSHQVRVHLTGLLCVGGMDD